MMASSWIARIKISLMDVEPPVVRRLEVPLNIRLDRLHLVIQAAMGWSGSHLYAFVAGGVSWGEPDPDFGDDMLAAAKITLREVLEDIGTKTVHYVYDFGDHWDHVVRIERIDHAKPGDPYPKLLLAKGRCPPEDVGGPPGYAEFLDTIADPEHEEHDEAIAWHGGHFDPHEPDLDRITADLDTLARKWASRPRKRKPSRTRS